MTHLQHTSTSSTHTHTSVDFRDTSNTLTFYKPPPLPLHLGCKWAVSYYSVFFWPVAMQITLAHVATTYLSMESTISALHPLILFCASMWVMLSVGSPSIAKIMSPRQRLAWAALLPGVTYNAGDKTDLKKRKNSKFCDKKCEIKTWFAARDLEAAFAIRAQYHHDLYYTLNILFTVNWKSHLQRHFFQWAAQAESFLEGRDTFITDKGSQ